MDALLDEPQIVLLCELVEATRRVPSDRREDFIAFHVMSSDSRIPVRHAGFQEQHYYAHPHDIAVLRDAGLITVTKDGQNLILFFVNPQGFRRYEHIKRTTGAPTGRVEAEVRRLIQSDEFQRDHAAAHTKWAKAEELLWGADSASQLSAIGHHCREAMQEFTTTLVSRYQPLGVNTNPSNTVARLKAVLTVASIGGLTERAFLEALVSYWGAVSDLVQRQEHAGEKERRAVTWDDARRVVFQTMAVMYEVARSL